MLVSLRKLTALTAIVALLLSLAACAAPPQQPAPAAPAPAPAPAPAAPTTPATTPAPAPAPTPAAGEPLIIGVSGDFAGPAAFFSKPFLSGLNTYIHHLNSQGGIDGRPVKLDVVDSGIDVPRSVTNVQELVDRGAIAVTGALLSQAWNAVLPLADRLQVPLIAPSAADNFVAMPHDFRYLTMLAMSDQAELNVSLIDDLAAQAGLQSPRVALLTVETAAAKDYHDRALELINERGWQIVDDLVLPATATDVSAQAASLASKRPDYVVAYLHDALARLAVTALRLRGMDAPILNYTYGSSESLFEALNDEQFYALRDFVWPAEDLPAAAAMRAQAEAAGEADGMTSLVFTNGYVTGILIAEALQRCSPDCTGPTLNQALESITSLDTGGLSGPLGFSATDHRMVDYGRLYRWNSSTQRTEPISDWTKVAR